jgi:hypothetical protein
MADKLIGSLIYGDHVPPKKQRPWKDRLKVPAAIFTVLLVVGGLAYKFVNYREERHVVNFFELLQQGQYDAAFATWDSDSHYTMKDFLVDWGKDGYYMEGLREFSIADSNSSGSAVVVYVELDTFKVPVAIRVDKETLKMTFSPVNKYKP